MYFASVRATATIVATAPKSVNTDHTYGRNYAADGCG
jgi:hypothetical protein